MSKLLTAVQELMGARELTAKDFEEYEVIRVADEIVVDLMTRASSLEFNDARSGILLVEVEGTPIPFAAPSLLLQMKQS